MNKILQLIGLAHKGKRILIGEDILSNIAKKHIELIILANDVSENTKKRFCNKALFYQIDIISLFSKEELGQCLGKNYISAVAILDSKLKNKIEEIIESR